MLNNRQNGMKVQKAFVKADDIASLRCPYCSFVKDVTVGKFRHNRHTIKAKCNCGKTFLVSFDFREHYRKRTELSGMYTLTAQVAHKSGQAQINNISRGGLSFSVSGIHNINAGQHAVVKFTLNNKKQTELTKRVIIKNVNKNTVGCEFVNQSTLGKDLGFFLRP